MGERDIEFHSKVEVYSILKLTGKRHRTGVGEVTDENSSAHNQVDDQQENSRRFLRRPLV